jgi:hypothetical protein
MCGNAIEPHSPSDCPFHKLFMNIHLCVKPIDNRSCVFKIAKQYVRAEENES